MSKYAIQVEGLGKEYIIGGAEQRHDSFREMLTGSLTAPFRRLRKLGGAAKEEERFWALKDVSFNVAQGEVLGVIGPNGAGKSTLLKVLSRITSPTTGRVVTRGRMASLMEVGTGFHPELTGRENIFLNGAILGMSRDDIQRRFDEIVRFAEIDLFLDTPVKRYSSGMYVRLAFSVAAHLDADILVVDEVLAVGDASFQKRCIGKIGSLSEQGRTVLFVSHNLNAIQVLTKSCLLLQSGRVIAQGPTFDILNMYAQESRESSGHIHSSTGHLRVVSANAFYEKLCGPERDLMVSIEILVEKSIDGLYLDFGLENQAGVRLLQVVPQAKGKSPVQADAGDTLVFQLQSRTTRLAPGDYFGTIYAHTENFGSCLHQSEIALFQVAIERDQPEVISSGFSAVLSPDYCVEVVIK